MRTAISLDSLLDLTPDPAHSPNRGAFKLGDFEGGCEHALDELLARREATVSRQNNYDAGREAVRLQMQCNGAFVLRDRLELSAAKVRI